MADKRNIPRRGKKLPGEGTPTDPAPPRRKKKNPSVVDRLASASKNQTPAGPGARGAASSSELMITSKIERLHTGDATPAPLPPSPAAEMAEVWFEQVPTNPAAIPDLDVLGASPTSSSQHIPATAPIRRLAPGRVGATGYNYDPLGTSGVLVPRPPWLLPSLIAAICLVVGILLGALLFGGGPSKDCNCQKPAETNTNADGKTKSTKPDPDTKNGPPRN